MMRKSLAITVVAFFACTLIGNAAPKKGPTPVITKVVADVWTATVFIEGQDFDLNAKVSWALLLAIHLQGGRQDPSQGYYRTILLFYAPELFLELYLKKGLKTLKYSY